MTARAANNTWQIWRFEPSTAKWTLISESFQSNGNGILRLFSDGITTFALTGDKKLYQFKNQQWEFFMDIKPLFYGTLGYYGWVYNNTLIMGENGETNAVIRPFKSINITTKVIDEQLPDQIFKLAKPFGSAARNWEVGPIQTTNKVFYVELIQAETLRMAEYYPK